jgi:alanyl-tRNA synthetase
MLKQEIKSTPFVGYESTTVSAKVKGCGTTDERLATLTAGASGEVQQFIVLDQSPFYAKSGGQESDAGKIVGLNGEFTIEELIKTGDMIVHMGKVSRSYGDSHFASRLAKPRRHSRSTTRLAC